MTDKKILEAIEVYRKSFEAQGHTPIRNSETVNKDHLLWMCTEIPNLLADGRREKVMRWLGFIQGSLWAMEEHSVEELKQGNKPDGVAYDAERV